MLNYAGEIELEAVDKAGELLKKLQKSKGGQPTQKRNSTAASVAGVSEYRQVLEQTKTPERTAQRWQKIAEVPEATIAKILEAACH